MKRSARKFKVLSTLATGGMMLQLGGCSLDGLMNQAQIGFARGIGAAPVSFVLDFVNTNLLGDLLGGGGDAAM